MKRYTHLSIVILLSLYFVVPAFSTKDDNKKSLSLPKRLCGEIDIVKSSCRAAGISFSSVKFPATITRVRQGSPAYYANLNEKDKVVSAAVIDRTLCLIIERNGRQFSTRLNIAPSESAEEISEPETILDKNMLQGNAVCNRLSDKWLQLFDKPEDLVLQAETNRLQCEIQQQVERNGGRWYRNQPYLSADKDPRFLLCAGVRLYAVGDLRNAVRLFEEVVSLNCDKESMANANFNLGAICEAQKKFKLAAYYYQKAHSLQPFDLEIEKTLNSLGKVPVLYEGGALEKVKPRPPIWGHIEDAYVCPLCRIVRNKIMNGG